jgi:hypothetical protein
MMRIMRITRMMRIENDAHHENDENENGNTPDDVGAGKLSTLSLPRLDVTEREANGAKHPKLLSPTEQGIRDSLKLERTRRLSSASKFNAGSTPGGVWREQRVDDTDGVKF